ncbi:unnamed protein product [Mycena citricolor]|uniref:HECT-type E3 ubiquitin transferase n=1 Tax=Mycena citricolor TaxID=2018698 RepID=A0AAD2JZ10_9AGAR|nr:unnamed protein product [Mycena citricolor]
MIPLFGSEGRRQINLGGASSVSTLASITDQAKARRLERSELRRRSDAAVRIQAWWRALASTRAARAQMQGVFERDVQGLTGLRCLVVLGNEMNGEVLRRWSQVVSAEGESALFAVAKGPNASSWLVLIRQAAALLLKSISSAPRSKDAVAHLTVLNMLLSPNVVSRNLGPSGREVCANIQLYLLRRSFFPLLSRSIQSIPPVEAKTSVSLPLILTLVTAPFFTLPSDSLTSTESFHAFIANILIIPLLPNRLPLTGLTHLSSHIPYNSFAAPGPPAIDALSIEDRVHVVANLTAFTPPRYKAMLPAALAGYIEFLRVVFDSLPANVFDGRSASKASPTVNMDLDSDSSDDGHAASASTTLVSVVSAFVPSAPRVVLPALDAKTQKRLATLVAPAHLNALLAATQRHPDASRAALFRMFLALERVWPGKRGEVLGAIMVGGHGVTVIKELWRGSVRRAHAAAILQEFTRLPSNQPPSTTLPAVLFLADLYTHALLTMGDDEFFGTSTATAVPRNPMSLDELTTFSRLLLDIAFGLYQGTLDDGHQELVAAHGPRGLAFTWEEVRERVTKCLLAIHARDSRRPFTPEDHWLVSGQIDMKSFIEAALFEELQMTTNNARAATSRQIARLAPRLGILHNIPFSIPFSNRVQVFRSFIENDRRTRAGPLAYTPPTRVVVRRAHISEDGFDRLRDVDLRGKIAITFIDQFDVPEAGIDGGGVFKEFFTSLCKEAFDTNRGLWLANKKNELYPNPHAYAVEPHSLNWYRFIGRIVGKAMYDGILVDIAFAGFFLAKWLGKQSFLDDLASLDPELYNGLVFLKHYTGNPEDLSLNFAVAVEDFGVTKSVDLIPNGSNIAVTKENRLQYIHLVSHYRLSRQIKHQSEAFFEGLSEIIDHKWLRMFNQQELQVLIGGTDSPVDLDDLQGHTQYGGLYDPNDATIVSFWKASPALCRRALFQPGTTEGAPAVRDELQSAAASRLQGARSPLCYPGRGAGPAPPAHVEHVCESAQGVFGLLLPRYTSESTLRTKLLQAITANAGFDLS